MMPNPTPLQPDALLETAAGSEYFTTVAHYQSVASRILAVLAGGGRFVLLTGSPPANGRLLSNALSKAAAGMYTVIGVPCGHNLNREDWRRLVRGPSGDVEIQEFSAAALLVTLGSPLPLYVLEDADQLSDEQLQEFFATWLFGEPTIGTAVLAVSPAFLARLERPALSFLIEGLAARMLFQHLGPDEIGTFLRQQLHGDDAENAFAPDTIAAIAAASGGDPALVNRLASRTLDAHRGGSAGPTQNPAARTVIAAPKLPTPDSSAETPPVLPPPDIAPPLPAPALLSSGSETAVVSSRPRRRSVGRRLVIGTIVALAYFGVLLVVGSFIPRYFRPSDDIPAATEQRPASAPSKAQVERPSVTSAEPSAAPALQTPASTGAGATPDVNPATIERSTKTETPAAAALNATEGAGSPASPPSSPAAASAPAMPDAPAVSDAALPASPGAAESTALAQSDGASDEIITLIARGDQFLTTGDIVSARLYYERAANAGSGHAAMLMGETFDPAFLGRAGVRGVRGDADTAAAWYRRARDLGDRDAERRFEIMESK
jgi:hypothetical protein